MDTTVVMASMLSSMLMEFIMPTTQSTGEQAIGQGVVEQLDRAAEMMGDHGAGHPHQEL